MIQDDELRALFQAESGEHLASLEACLLQIEQRQSDEQTLNQVFRDAHSLKGAARMLELSDIELVMHAMEDLLRPCRDSNRPPEPAALETLLASLDAVKALVAEAVQGKSSSVELRQVVEALHRAAAAVDHPTSQVSEQETKAAQTRPPIAVPGTTDTHDSPPAEEKAGTTDTHDPPPAEEKAATPEPQEPSASIRPKTSSSDEPEAPYQIDTIRVPTARLDTLLHQCGELIVTQQRMLELETGLGRLLSELEKVRRAPRRSEKAPRLLDPLRARDTAAAEQARGLREQARSENRRLETLARSLAENVRSARMLPLSTLFSLFPRMVRDIAHEEGKQVELLVDGGETTADKNVVEGLKDPMMHALRNAVHHGIEPAAERVRVGKPEQGRIELRAVRLGASVQITIMDDGRGVDIERAAAAIARFDSDREAASPTPGKTVRSGAQASRSAILDGLFQPGVTTETMITDISGRGVGLDVVRRGVEDLKGSVQIRSEEGRFFEIELELPITLATTRVLMLRSGELLVALPLEDVQRLFRLAPDQLYRREGEAAIDDRGEALSVLDLGEVFGQTTRANERRRLDAEHCVIIGRRERRIALLVDAVSGTQDVLMRPIGGILRRLRGLAGSAILSSGDVCAVLSSTDLLEMPIAASTPTAARPIEEPADDRSRSDQVLLLVEDSMLTRLQEKRLLESAGYRVITAADGAAAWEMMNPSSGQEQRPFGRRMLPDAVVADINMPRMDGLQLTQRMRADSRLRATPIVLVTSLASAEDQRRGLDAGANAYITKGSFNNQLLLSTLERLL